MHKDLNAIINELEQTSHGFKHIVEAGNELFTGASEELLETASSLTDYPSYQGRMLGVYLLGRLSIAFPEALVTLQSKVSQDENWRVQEMLAKSFDHYCEQTGYEKALPEIEKWLSHDHPNVKRAVIEGLRVWTSRPYFNENPELAIRYISEHKLNKSEYLRKSIGNALRDIRKKYPGLIDTEVLKWNLKDSQAIFVRKLIYK